MIFAASPAQLIEASRAKPGQLIPRARPHGQTSSAKSSARAGAGDGVSLTLSMLRTFDVPAHFVFAYKKTGLLVTEETSYRFSDDELMCWDAALLEYFRSERQTKTGAGSAAVH